MRLYNAEIWQGKSGVWYVNDVTNLTSKASLWWFPIRLLDVTIEEFFEILKKHNASNIKYSEEHNFLFYSFSSRTDAANYRDLLNSTAKRRGIFVE